MSGNAQATHATPAANGGTPGQPSYAELLAMVQRLQAEASQPKDAVSFTIAEKGGVSAVGIGRFPTTLYYEQWIKLLDASERQGLRRKLAEWLSTGKILLKGAKDEQPQAILARSIARGQADLAALAPVPAASVPASQPATAQPVKA